jgi:hypothetical protein
VHAEPLPPGRKDFRCMILKQVGDLGFWHTKSDAKGDDRAR